MIEQQRKIERPAQAVRFVDTLASGASGLTAVEVRVFSWAPLQTKPSLCSALLFLPPRPASAPRFLGKRHVPRHQVGPRIGIQRHYPLLHGHPRLPKTFIIHIDPVPWVAPGLPVMLHRSRIIPAVLLQSRYIRQRLTGIHIILKEVP